MSVLSSPPSSVVAAGAWVGGSNAFVSDNVYATLSTTTSSSLDLGGFNFASIPTGSTVNSVTVALEHFENQTNQITFSVVVLDNATTIDTLSPTLQTVESVNNLSMITLPTLAQLQSATFKVRLTGGKQGGGGSRNFSVDSVSVSVDYTAPPPVTGTMATTEASDSASFSGTVITDATGTLAAANANDTVNISASEVIGGTLSVTSADDSVAISGTETISGMLAATESSDSVNAAAMVINPVTGTVAVTEASDLVGLGGLVLDPITGTAAVTESGDVVSIVANVRNPVYVFEPPTHEEPMRTQVAPLVRYRLTYAASVVRVNGALITIRTPSPEIIAAAGEEGVDYFRGGCVYEITAQTATELEAAGYTVRVE